MKKNLSLLAAFLVVGFCATPASAADHYVSGMGGISWMNDIKVDYSEASSEKLDMSSGLTLLGAIGCDYGDYRLEAELGYQQNDIKNWKGNTPVQNEVVSASVPMDGDVSILSLMANGYYDVDLGGVELYATAGVGVAQVSFDDVKAEDETGSTTEHETTLAWQVGAGVAAPIADNIKLDLRYRYFATTDFWEDTNVASHSVLLGLRVGF